MTTFIAVGILVASTLMEPDMQDNFHKSNIYQYNYQGEVMGVLPSLGKGPHSFLPVHLGPSQEAANLYPEMSFDEPAWYVYCKDGHGGISCFRPSQ